MWHQKVRLQAAKATARLAKKLAPWPAASGAKAMLDQIDAQQRHLRGVVYAQKMIGQPKPIMLELGGGVQSEQAAKGWLNVDLWATDGLTLDLRRPLPFPDQSVQAIHSEHLLEHLQPEDLFRLLAEVHRVLKVDGEVRMGVPDAGRAFEAYAQGPLQFYRDKFWSNVHPESVASPMDEINYLIYMEGHHVHMFDQQNLIYHMQLAGFADPKIVPFDVSLDRMDRRAGTTYVHAMKTNATPNPIQVRQSLVKQIVESLAAAPEIAPLVAHLTPASRHVVLRLATLIAGRNGKTLVLGEHHRELLAILEQCKVPERELLCIDSDQGPFRQVLAICNPDEPASDSSLFEMMQDDGYARAIVVCDYNAAKPGQLKLVHEESLPDDGLVLRIMDRPAA